MLDFARSGFRGLMSGKTKIPRWVFAADIVAGICAILFVYFISRYKPSLIDQGSESFSLLNALFYVSFVLIALTDIALAGDYNKNWRYSRLNESYILLRSTFLAFVLLVSAAFILEGIALPEGYEFSRVGILFLIAFLLPMLFIIRIIAHHRQSKLFGSGGWRKKMIIVGAGDEGEKVYRHFQKKNWLGVNCLGFIDPRVKVSPVAGTEVLGDVEMLPALITDQGVEEIVIALPPTDHDIMENIVNNGVRHDVEVRIIPDSFAYPYSDLDIQEYDGLAMIEVKQPNLDAMHKGVKRALDIMLASVMLVISLPFWLIIVAAIRLTSKGPAIFRQTRLGRDGKTFEMMKFRSMVLGAADMRQGLERDNEASGPIFKMRKDPRVTGIGSFLRRMSIDEIPQIINVLKGDMSFVGPRPPLPEEVSRYRSHHLKRLAVRPGITGLWQVSGRDRRDFEEMARLDLYYIENWSTWLDLKIIIKTVPTVLSRKGAY
jgi:exopolysaccharide biosynthesis polyprenyl glycosylphosphotransferase